MHRPVDAECRAALRHSRFVPADVLCTAKRPHPEGRKRADGGRAVRVSEGRAGARFLLACVSVCACYVWRGET